jgi:SsrA-binding protein
MDGAYIKFRPSEHKGLEAWVVGLQIFPYKHADNENYDPQRTRKLLLHQKEILEIVNKMKQMSRLVIPTAMYTKSGLVKMEVGLARGKKKYEKREAIKKRDADRARYQ